MAKLFIKQTNNAPKAIMMRQAAIIINASPRLKNKKIDKYQ